MNVPIELVQIAFVLVVIVLPTAVFIRVSAGHEDYGFGILVPSSHELPWPKGVQEEEPQPWKFGPAFASPGGPSAQSRGQAHQSDRAARLPAPSTSGC